MVTNRHCKRCKTLRKIDLWDFIKSKKKRVVCGVCGMILMSEEEAHEIFYYCGE